MKSNEEIQVRNHKDWSLKILQQEVELLRREKHHLTSKSHERPLTDWESNRMEQLFNEITNIMGKLAEAVGRGRRFTLSRI